ncbi:MAG: creatininase family protein [Halobacteriales archaeon]
MYLGDIPWPELGDYVASEQVAMVPLGSTEQHGPHLPLATDHLIAEGLARAAADRSGYLCTPTVNVGVSPHHKQFHGTMWVDPPVFRDYVESLTRNLTYHGIERIVYVNAHGGNVRHLREVGRKLRAEDVCFACEWMWDESIPDLVDELFEQNGPHGGPKETAMIMHLAGDLVAEDRLADARDHGVYDVEQLEGVHGSRVTYDAVDSSENGAFGDQTDATAEKGEQLFEAAVEELIGLLDWVDDQPRGELMEAPHVDPAPNR